MRTWQVIILSMILITVSLLSVRHAYAEDVLLRWRQEGTVASTWVVFYIGTSTFDPDASPTINGDVHVIVKPTPVPTDGVVIDSITYDGVHALVVTTPTPLPPIKLHYTMKARVGMDGQLSPPSNSYEMIEHIPVPEAPILLGNGAAFWALAVVRRRRGWCSHEGNSE